MRTCGQDHGIHAHSADTHTTTWAAPASAAGACVAAAALVLGRSAVSSQGLSWPSLKRPCLCSLTYTFAVGDADSFYLPPPPFLTTVIPSWGAVCQGVLQAPEGRSPPGAAPRRSSLHRGGQHRRGSAEAWESVCDPRASGQRWKEVLYCQGEEGLPNAASLSPRHPTPPHLMALPRFFFFFFNCDFTFIYSHFYKLGFFLLFFHQLLSPLSLTSSARAFACIGVG